MSINITGGSSLPIDTTDALIASTGANTENRFATLSDVGGAGLEVLPLIGGTMTGNIAWSAGGQFIGVGLDDFGLGGYAGLSQVCSVGYDLNWQAGWLTAFEQNRTTTRPLFLNSGYGTSLKVWDYDTDTGTEISHVSISTSGEGATITHNNGEFDTYTLQNGDLTFNSQAFYSTPSNMQIAVLGLTFPDGSFQSTAASTPQVTQHWAICSYNIGDAETGTWTPNSNGWQGNPNAPASGSGIANAKLQIILRSLGPFPSITFEINQQASTWAVDSGVITSLAAGTGTTITNYNSKSTIHNHSNSSTGLETIVITCEHTFEAGVDGDEACVFPRISWADNSYNEERQMTIDCKYTTDSFAPPL